MAIPYLSSLSLLTMTWLSEYLRERCKDFKYFFLTTKEASRYCFFIEIAKFFDTLKKSLTINKVIDYAEKNITKFTKQDFLDSYIFFLFSNKVRIFDLILCQMLIFNRGLKWRQRLF